MKKTFVIATILAGFFSVSLAGSSVDSLYFQRAEQELMQLANEIADREDDAGRLEANHRFMVLFEEVLRREHGFSYPFDSLQTVSVLPAPGRDFRIITWYVPLSGQQFRYFGFIQRAGSATSEHLTIPLRDATPDLLIRDEGELDADRWFGAYYYDLIHHRVDGEDFYTLLGWKGNSPLTRIRVIEPLSFSDGLPVFGRQLFDHPFGDHWRIVFEYAARVSMSLLYEKDFFREGDLWHPMIVFDRLTPINRSLEGHYQFYKPEVNIFDGFYFWQGRWVFVGDVDARLPETP
ncbi:MAG: hypothetical protein EA394_01385 [Bacteroidia bacterium]|nr:MAG: hypothetical protein EA394_01385 [Bacteroidia bacterium]